MRAIAIIPARGGSKGLPRKNVLPLHGRPMITWTIDAALSTPEIIKVFVSTDDPEIASISRVAGAHVIDRPAKLATDEASSESALLHALDNIERMDGTVPEHTVFLQCTSPLTLPDDITGTLEQLNTGADSALAVTAFHHFLWRNRANGAEGINHDKAMRQRRQDREIEWLETGSVYAFKSAEFRTEKKRFFGRVGLYPIAPERVLEIDSLADFELAAARLKVLRS